MAGRESEPNKLFTEARMRLFETQQDLADAVNEKLPGHAVMTYSDVGKLERGRVRAPRSPRIDVLCEVLQVERPSDIGLTRRSRRKSRTTRPPLETAGNNVVSTSRQPGQLAIPRPALLTLSSYDQSPRSGVGAGQHNAVLNSHYLVTPPGRALPGVAIPTQVHAATDHDHVVIQIPAGYAADPFLHQPHRALVAGKVHAEPPATYALDIRRARRQLNNASADVLTIPRAYLLDDLTAGLLWAVGNFDAVLLNDDAVLTASVQDLTGYAQMPKSAASLDIALDLSPASIMWLGSQFCAAHIRRHVAELEKPPLFWTREQRGEEAASWLLFAHKQDYLRATAATSQAEQATRVFCIPAAAVTSSPAAERVLLLLAVALIESYGIRTAITDEPGLAATPGFVLSPRQRAITASWLGASGIWHVDVTSDRTVLADYADAAGHAIGHSLTAAATPQQRLQRLAEYLGLDWHWLAVRCRQLGDRGSSGIVQPRSRLLSLEGVDRACRFVAACTDDHD